MQPPIPERRPGTALALALAFAATGCKVGPDYEEPETPLPDDAPLADEWLGAVEAELSTEEPDITRWWEALDDPLLTDLIRRSDLSNLDLRIAFARVEEAAAIQGIAEGPLYPTVTLDGSVSRRSISTNSPLGALTGGDLTQWEARGGSFWEIDAFGRIRRNIEGAEARYEATIEDYRDVQVSVYAAVAGSYVNVRALQARLDYALQNAAAQRESLELTRDRYQAGLTSALDVAQAEQNLAQTEASIPSLESGLVASENRLAVLLGLEAGRLHDELEEGRGELPEIPRGIIAGVPADLLRRRPDIRRAERLLAGETADIGVATADLYPTFSIDGFIETVAGSAGDLVEGDSLGWGIIPGFRWDIFRGGAIRSNIRAQEARTQQALVSYQGTVLDALEEVSNGLVAYDRELIRRDRLRAAADASQRAVSLVRTQYVSGLTNFQNLLDTQRSLFQQQDQLADSEGRVVLNLVFLNRALGGGWSLPSDEPETEETP